MQESRDVVLLHFFPDKMESRDVVLSNVFSDKMNEYRAAVNDAISSELYLMRDSPFFKPLADALDGGKRLRAILLLLAFQSVGGSEMDPIPAAVAVEIIHSGSLMVDDIIDEDLTRRDAEAFHASHGLKISILNAEMLFSVVLSIVARCLDHRVTHVLAQAVKNLGHGVFEELAVCTTKQPISIYEYIDILRRKTAFLFEASAKMGALVAGAQEDEVSALSDYGRLLGLAYQVQDDIADREEETARSLLSFLDGEFRNERYLTELSTSYITEAKQRLQVLKSSEAKNLLMKLADTIGMHSVSKMQKVI